MARKIVRPDPPKPAGTITLSNDVCDILLANSALRQQVSCLAATTIEKGCCGRPATKGYDGLRACLATTSDDDIRKIASFLGATRVKIFYGVLENDTRVRMKTTR